MSKFKTFLQSIGDFIKDAFTNIKDLLEAKAPQAVRLTQIVKEAIEEHDGKIEWVLEKLKSEGLDELYMFAKKNLPVLIHELAVVDGLVQATDSNSIAWEAYVSYLKSKTKQSRVKDIVFLAAEILGYILGFKAPKQALIIATQKAYHLIFGSKK